MNNLDFDGCDKLCQIEFNYACDNNGGLTADTCTSIYYPPIVEKDELNTNTMEVTFTWNDTMIDYAISDLDLVMVINGPSEPYSVQWTSKFSSNVLVLGFSSSPALIGGVGETLMIEFSNTNAFKSGEQIPISSSKIFNYNFDEISPSATSQSANSGAGYTFVITMAISLGVSLLTGGSMELMWSLTNTLQIIFFFGMLNLYYSAELKEIFVFMAFSNFDNPATRYLTSLVMGGFSFISSPVSTKFNAAGFHSTDIVSNSFDKIFMVFLLI